MREGRAALVTSFGCFKYMALYSFIQFISVIILYTYGVNLGDFQFLYIDLVITTTIAILMGYTKAYEKLVSARPDGSLVKLSNIMSILLQVLFSGIFQFAALMYLIQQPWYKRVQPTEDMGNTPCSETTVVFITSSFQYIVVAFCFSKGPPFRKPIYTNIPYILSLLALVGFSSIILLVHWDPLMKLFQLKDDFMFSPLAFRGLLLAIIAGHFVAAFLTEVLVTETRLFKKCKSCCRKREPKSMYKRLLKEIEVSNWPPVGQVTHVSANGNGVNSSINVEIEAIHLSSIH